MRNTSNSDTNKPERSGFPNNTYTFFITMEKEESIRIIETPNCLASCPDWPDRRSYADITNLHIENSREAAESNRCASNDFASELIRGATVIDIGAGQGKLISELRQISIDKGLNWNLIAVSATELNKDYIKAASCTY